MKKLYSNLLKLLFLSIFFQTALAGTPNSIKRILDFKEQQFFNVKQSVLSQRESQLLDIEYFGISINAPTHVLVEKNNQLPIIVATRFTALRNWQYVLADSLLLVGVNLNNGESHVVDALATEKDLKYKQSPVEDSIKRPPEDELSSEAAQVFKIDARKQLNMAWQPSIWSFGLIYHDWKSNTIKVKLDNKRHGSCSMTKKSKLGFDVISKTNKKINLISTFTMPKHLFKLSGINNEINTSLLVINKSTKRYRKHDLTPQVKIKSEAKGMIKGVFNIFIPHNELPLKKGEYIGYLILGDQIVGPKSFNIAN